MFRKIKLKAFSFILFNTHNTYLRYYGHISQFKRSPENQPKILMILWNEQ